MAENKKSRTSIVDVDGVKYKFKFHAIAGLAPEDLLCEKFCPLNDICDKLKDPRNMGDDEASFMDFCLAAGQKDKTEEEIMNDESITNLIPDLEGVIKFADATNTDIYQELIKSHPLVDLNDVIDHVCSENGYNCPMYNKEHTGCTNKNGLCVLKSMFKA
jgi:hypothetical protein